MNEKLGVKKLEIVKPVDKIEEVLKTKVKIPKLEELSYKSCLKYFLKLEKMCKQYKSYAEMGFIFDTKNLLNLKDSPTDRGKETFLKLYKEAHWIK
jgi:hypothetical protein